VLKVNHLDPGSSGVDEPKGFCWTGGSRERNAFDRQERADRSRLEEYDSPSSADEFAPMAFVSWAAKALIVPTATMALATLIQAAG
jgi:hypothetical protein